VEYEQMGNEPLLT